MKKEINNKLIKGVIWLLKSFSIGIVLLFIYNIIGSFFNLNIPINLWTIIIVSLLKLPGLVAIIIYQLIS